MSAGESDWLYQVLKETDLTAFYSAIKNDLQVTKLEHFKFVTNDDLKRIHLAPPSIKRLRDAIDKKKSQLKRQRIISMIGGRSGNSPKTTLENERFGDDEVNTITCLIPAEQLKKFETLGEGSFGVVKRGLWTRTDGKKIHVAVKELFESINLVEELAQEVNGMFHLKHQNLVRLYGIVFTKPIMMVLELCEGGSLLDRLRTTDKQKFLVSDLWSLAKQIVSGMAYLEEKRCIHRDLAARNVLLSLDEKMAKIGDFGLMRVLSSRDQHYVMSGQKKVPFPWCAPESLKFKKFSNLSDVWMFGVTLWEMFSYGAEPWCGYKGPEILKLVLEGQRLAQSKECPMAVYDLMLRCWSQEAQDRPTFALLSNSMQKYDFLTAITKEAQKGTDDLLDLIVDDQIVVINGRAENYFWFGQSVRTKEFGNFAHKLVVVNQSGCASGIGTVRDISRPIPGSFVHAGHGDGRGGDSWGFPDRIDPLYLQNPMPLLNGGGETAQRRGAQIDQLKAPSNTSGGRSESSSGSLMSFDDFDDDIAPDEKFFSPEDSSTVGESVAKSTQQRSAYYSLVPGNTLTTEGDIYAPINKVHAKKMESSGSPDFELNENGRLYMLPPAEPEITVKKISPPVTKPKRPPMPLALSELPPMPLAKSQLSSMFVEKSESSAMPLAKSKLSPMFVEKSESSAMPLVKSELTPIQPPVEQAIQQRSAVHGRDTFDPFEVSPEVLKLANNRRYADHFEISSNSSPNTSNTADTSWNSNSSLTPNSSTNSFSQTPLMQQPAPPTNRLSAAVVEQLIYDVNRHSHKSVETNEISRSRPVTSGNFPVLTPPASSSRSPGRRNRREDQPASAGGNVVVRIPVPADAPGTKETKENFANELVSRLQEKRQTTSADIGTDVKLRSPTHSTVAAYDNYLTRETLAWVAAQQQQNRAESTIQRNDAHRGSLPAGSFASIRPVTAYIPPPNTALGPAYFHHPSTPQYHQHNSMSRVASMPSTSGYQPAGLLSSAVILQPSRPVTATTAAVTPAVLDLFDPLVGKVPDQLVKAVQKEVPNQSVGVCQQALKAVELDVQKAIEKLKIDELSNSFSFDKQRAKEALVKFNWDMNRAADFLLS